MKKICFLFYLNLILISCSSPKLFLVKNVVNNSTIELENKTLVRLIGVNSQTNKYVNAINELPNSYVELFNEDYDPIKEITGGEIFAYVYNENGECINDFTKGSDSEKDPQGSTEIPVIQPEEIVVAEERISGKEIEILPVATLAEMYEKNKNAVFLIAVPKGNTNYAQGTGFFIEASGIGVSNFHVFEGGIGKDAIIKTIDNHQYKIRKIIKSSKELDFIVFEVENNHYDFPYLKLTDSKLGTGNDVFAIGNPKGLEHTLSKGIISSYRENDKLIQITAEITNGSSGGPLFNMSGEVIGITTSGIGEANLNFAMNVLKLGIE